MITCVITPGDIIDRPMTPEEIRGFRYACACLKTMGRQIKDHQITPRAFEMDVPFGEMIRHGGAVLEGCARALEQTLNQKGMNA